MSTIGDDSASLDGGNCNLLQLTLEEMHTPDSAIRLSVLACIFFTLLVFVLSEVSKNYSQTDKLWSITPFIYAWILVVDKRTLLMAIITTVSFQFPCLSYQER